MPGGFVQGHSRVAPKLAAGIRQVWRSQEGTLERLSRVCGLREHSVREGEKMPPIVSRALVLASFQKSNAQFQVRGRWRDAIIIRRLYQNIGEDPRSGISLRAQVWRCALPAISSSGGFNESW